MALCKILLLQLVLLTYYTFGSEDFKINDDYQLILERSSFVYRNEKYMHTARAVSFKYNRTHIGMNISLGFSFDIRRKLYAVAQTYRFASNEYRLFPLRFGTKFCEMIEGELGGLKYLRECGNFTTCDFVKGETYTVCSYVPDGSKFPPHIPSGKYMFELTGSSDNIKMYVMKSYLEVKRPEVKNYKSFFSTRSPKIG